MASFAVGFSGNSIRFVGLSEDKQLSHISELETDFNFDDEIPAHHGDEHLISELASVICDNLKKVDDISSSKVSLVINTMQIFSNVMPLDVVEDEQVTSSNILWDTSIYYPDEYENFNINYYRLKKLSPEDSSDNIYNVLVLGINRNIINFYRRIFDECGLKLDLFDSDHSAATGLISAKEIDNTYGLLGLKPGRIDLSINRDDEIKYFDYSYTGSFDFKRELDKDLTTLELDDNFADVKTIYIYGESLLESVKEYLEQKYSGIEIKILDPLENYTGDESSVDNILHFSSAARFAPLFGLALKSLEQE